MRRWCLSALSVLWLLLAPAQAMAAEVLQVRSGTLLQIGDHNRTYTVRLACVAVAESDEALASGWLRQQLPRRSKVNLRPRGSDDGVLIAGIEKQNSRGSLDIGNALVEAGFATASPSC